MQGSSLRVIATTMNHDRRPTTTRLSRAAPRLESATSRSKTCGRTTTTKTWLASKPQSLR
eukprot:411354-Pleurochrysis_carterae.AAC.1